MSKSQYNTCIENYSKSTHNMTKHWKNSKYVKTCIIKTIYQIKKLFKPTYYKMPRVFIENSNHAFQFLHSQSKGYFSYNLAYTHSMRTQAEKHTEIQSIISRECHSDRYMTTLSTQQYASN